MRLPTFGFGRCLAVLLSLLSGSAFAGNGSGAHGGDNIYLAFTLAQSELSNNWQKSAIPSPGTDRWPQARAWFEAHRNDYLSEIVQAQFIRETHERSECGETNAKPLAPIGLDLEKCRGSVIGMHQAAQILIHEVTHHFGASLPLDPDSSTYDQQLERFCDEVAFVVTTRIWAQVEIEQVGIDTAAFPQQSDLSCLTRPRADHADIVGDYLVLTYSQDTEGRNACVVVYSLKDDIVTQRYNLPHTDLSVFDAHVVTKDSLILYGKKIDSGKTMGWIFDPAHPENFISSGKVVEILPNKACYTYLPDKDRIAYFGGLWTGSIYNLDLTFIDPKTLQVESTKKITGGILPLKCALFGMGHYIYGWAAGMSNERGFLYDSTTEAYSFSYPEEMGRASADFVPPTQFGNYNLAYFDRGVVHIFDPVGKMYARTTRLPDDLVETRLVAVNDEILVYGHLSYAPRTNAAFLLRRDNTTSNMQWLKIGLGETIKNEVRPSAITPLLEYQGMGLLLPLYAPEQARFIDPMIPH